jgi:UDP-N-acetylmuramoyl-tripeptide--D-alanyl-D-alanine ligase
VHRNLAELARLCDGEVEGPGAIDVKGYSVDSRSINSGDLFIPLVAERDGHDFVKDAFKAGAVAHLQSNGISHGPSIRVEDTLKALQVLAQRTTEILPTTVVGVTGSVGKTTTKDMLRSCLEVQYQTWASQSSFNNEIGVPLTILRAPGITEFLVLEMGARGEGQISSLCEIASPLIGVVTQVGLAHSEFFGGLEGIIRAKSELIESLPSDGLAVLNGDDENVRNMQARTSANVLLFGSSGGDVVAEEVFLGEDLCPRFVIRSEWGSSEVALATPGLHNVNNALAAATVSLYCNVPLVQVVASLEMVQISPLRMEISETKAGVLLINDAYNANPLSMSAALETLASSSRTNLIAVLGLMAELGPEAEQSHCEIGNKAEQMNISVISVGVPEYGGKLVENLTEAVSLIQEMMPFGNDTAILLKGSRIAGLERIANELFSEQ